MKQICNVLVFGLLFFSPLSFLSSDTVFVKTTKETFENVKTSPAPKKGETLIEEKNGTTRTFKTNQLTITPAPLVWEEPKPVEEERSFLQRMFGGKKEEQKSVADEVKETKPSVAEAAGSEKEEPKSAFDKNFPEVAIGTMAFLWLFL